MLIKKIFFSLFFIAIGWILCNLYNTTKKEKNIPEVSVLDVKRQVMIETISLKTNVSEERIENITSSANSRVNKILVKPGDYVEKGMLLLELYQDDLVNELKEAEVKLDKERYRLALLSNIPLHPDYISKNEEIQKLEGEAHQAQQELEDAKELYEKKASALREVEKQEQEVKRLKISLNKEKRERETLIKQLGDEREEKEAIIPTIVTKIRELNNQIKGCKVYSTINGCVKQISVRKNQKVEYGSLLLTVSTRDEIIAKGSLKEGNFFLVKDGQKTELASEVLGKRFSGRVLKVYQIQKDEKDKTGSEGWEVISSINDPKWLVPGMELSCDIVIKENKKPSLVIPPEALYEEDSVMVVENGRLKKKSITIGESTTSQIEVISGLKEGERIVVQYDEELNEGMRVKVK